MAFNFPDPAVSTTATNPVTGAQYQWKADPGKWVLTGGPAAVTPPVTIDLLPPESPQVGDLWIHQESLIEYAWDGTQWFEVGASCGGASEEEEEVDFNVPFTNSYKLVSPNNFTGADGTATLETDAYADGFDSFISPSVQIARFATRDLNGKKHEEVSKDESFELAPTTYEASDTIKPAYGIFKVTSLDDASEYYVDYDNTRAFRFIEGDTIYYRPSFTGDYVKKEGGDIMEGPLEITGPRSAGSDSTNPNQESTLKVYNIENRNSSYLGLKHDGTTKVYVGGDDVSIANDIKFNRGAGSTIKSNVQDLLKVNERDVAYLGQSLEDESLINKKYVDDTKDFLQNEIVELEEEIEALAPSLERGTWLFNPTGSAGSGQFSMYGIGTPTKEFTQTDALFINSVDSNGSLHSFSDVSVDSYVEVFSGDDADFGLYQIKVIHDETGGANSFWHFEVEHIRSNRVLAEASSVCRFKFFNLADAADATSFVLKAGDTMTGDLTMEYPNKIAVKNLVALPNEALVIAYGDTWRISVNEDKVNFNKPAHCAKEVTEDNQLVNKKYVDQVVDGLNEIVEDALKPINYDVTDPPTNLQFLQNDTTSGYCALTTGGSTTTGNTAYGIWMSDSMLENFVTEVSIDDWVEMWNGSGTITLNGFYTGGDATRNLTEVSRHTHNTTEGVKFRWSSDDNSIHVGSFINYFKTADAFFGKSPLEVPSTKHVSGVTIVWNGIGNQNSNVTADYPTRLDPSGNPSSSHSHAGDFFPFEFLKTLHPNAAGFTLTQEGVVVRSRPNESKAELATLTASDGTQIDGVKVYQTFGTYSDPNMSHTFNGMFISTDFDHIF